MLGRKAYIEYLEMKLDKLAEQNSSVTDSYSARRYTYMSRETFEDTVGEINSEWDRIESEIERVSMPLAQRIERRKQLKRNHPDLYSGKVEWTGKVII